MSNFSQFPKKVDNFPQFKGARTLSQKVLWQSSNIWWFLCLAHLNVHCIDLLNQCNIFWGHKVRCWTATVHPFVWCTLHQTFLGALVTLYLMTIPCVWLYISKLNLIAGNHGLIECDFHQGLIFLHCITRYYSYMYNEVEL